MSDDYNDENLDWQYTKSPNKAVVPPEIRNSFVPRVSPHSVFATIDGAEHKMDPKVYLISYSNGQIAIGVIKNRKDVNGDHPATMQFGNWMHREGKRIPIGSEVIVRSYSRMVDCKNGGIFRPFAYNKLFMPHLFSSGCLYSNTMAVEWAFLEKPKITKSIGYVTKFEVIKTDKAAQRFWGRVYDQENNVEVEVHDDYWPYYSNKQPEIQSAVVIQWIYYNQPHCVFTNYFGFKFLFPSYASEFLEVTESDPDYWLHRVDTRFV